MDFFYKKEKIVELPNKAIIKMAKYSPDGKTLALVATDKHISLISIIENVYTLQERINCTQYTAINDIDFSIDSTIIGAAADNVLVLFGNQSGKLFKAIRPAEIGERQFKIIQFGHGNALVGVTYYFMMYIYYDYAESELKYLSFNPYKQEITSINFISHSYIITSYENGECLRWNATTDTQEDQEYLKISDLTDNIPIKITHSTLSPDNKYLLLTHLCSKLTSWKIEDTVGNSQNGRRSVRFFQQYLSIIAIKEGEFEIKGKFLFHNNDRFVISASDNNRIQIWDFVSAETRMNLSCLACSPLSIIIIPTSNIERFACLQRDGKLFIWKKAMLPRRLENVYVQILN